VYLTEDKVHSSNVSGSKKMNLRIEFDELSGEDLKNFRNKFKNVKNNPKSFCNVNNYITIPTNKTYSISCDNIDKNNEFFITILTAQNLNFDIFYKKQ
jgi:hypothetical protein